MEENEPYESVLRKILKSPRIEGLINDLLSEPDIKDLTEEDARKFVYSRAELCARVALPHIYTLHGVDIQVVIESWFPRRSEPSYSVVKKLAKEFIGKQT